MISRIWHNDHCRASAEWVLIKLLIATKDYYRIKVYPVQQDTCNYITNTVCQSFTTIRSYHTRHILAQTQKYGVQQISINKKCVNQYKAHNYYPKEYFKCKIKILLNLISAVFVDHNFMYSIFKTINLEILKKKYW